jgi:hypothetical protein
MPQLRGNEPILGLNTYDYNNYAQLRIFPSILKEISLKWFIGLDIHNIYTLETMKNRFIEKYTEY